jgi:hypothetical protein
MVVENNFSESPMVLSAVMLVLFVIMENMIIGQTPLETQ